MARLTTTFLAGLFLAGALGVHPALAAEPAGEAVKILETARAQGQAGARFLKVKGPVYAGDRITTNERGQAQLRFVDDTRMVVGPNSQVTIDSFVFETTTNAKEITLDAVRGAFRFITGSSDKQAYTISIPAGTIGVRGTEFDISIGEDGTATVALYAGGLRVCDRSSPRRCTVIEQSCTMLVIPPADDFKWVRNVYERTAKLDTEFPYAFRQFWLDRDFRIETGSCEIRDPSGGVTPGDPGDDSAPASGGGQPPVVIL